VRGWLCVPNGTCTGGAPPLSPSGFRKLLARSLPREKEYPRPKANGWVLDRRASGPHEPRNDIAKLHLNHARCGGAAQPPQGWSHVRASAILDDPSGPSPATCPDVVLRSAVAYERTAHASHMRVTVHPPQRPSFGPSNLIVINATTTRVKTNLSSGYTRKPKPQLKDKQFCRIQLEAMPGRCSKQHNRCARSWTRLYTLSPGYLKN